MKRVFVTGAAGFIGFHASKALCAHGIEVLGVDSLTAYYPVKLKEDRLAQLRDVGGFHFERHDIADAARTRALMKDFAPDAVLHLAAQAGVRYSLQDPFAYTHSNVVGFLSILEAVRALGERHLVFASSSSVYGANTKIPFAVTDNVDHPVSLYAATKKSNELMAHSYSHLFGIPVTGLRFFTVYGPWGRPDMAYHLFTRAILEGKPLDVFNHGRMKRDFTYVDDVVESLVRLLARPPDARPVSADGAPLATRARYRIYNVGNHEPVGLLDMIRTLERLLGREAQLVYRDMQPGDVEITYADTAELRADIGFAPRTELAKGLEAFVEWYRGYYG